MSITRNHGGRWLRASGGLLALGVALAAAGAQEQAAAPESGTSAREIGAPPSSALAEQIDTLLDSFYPAAEPGAAVLAARHGAVVYRGARGLASVELQVPIDPAMTFCLASITKSFTAVAVMMLVEEEQLFLGDRVTDFLPDLVHCEEVTVENLLTHTSGIPDMGSVPGYMTEKIHAEVSPDDLAASVKDLPPGFAPGERFEYSNTNYAILGRIVELVSGEPWEEFLRRRVFEPSHMTSSFYGGHLRIVPGAVTGYAQEEDGTWQRAAHLSFTRGFGLGGLFSSVDDMARWGDALLAGKLVSDETREQMFTPFVLEDGSASSYAYGFTVSETRGHRVVGHSGGIFGWRTDYRMLPEDGIFVVVLTNRQSPDNDPADVVRAIVALLLGAA